MAMNGAIDSIVQSMLQQQTNATPPQLPPVARPPATIAEMLQRLRELSGK